MKFKSIILVAVILAGFTACSDSEDEPKPVPEPEVPEAPVVTVSLDESFIEMTVGTVRTVGFTVEPADTVPVWTSSDSRIATVDENGAVTGVARGTATITAKVGTAKASVLVKVVRAPQVGDFYYSDGSFSPNVVKSKTLIGVVFWIGDPTADDAALRRDHPQCTNGLVVAANPDMKPTPWQSNASAFRSTTGAWIEANLAGQYESTVSVWTKDTRRNVIAGYNNTRAIELFNAAAENSQWPVDAVSAVVAFRSQVPAPASSSDWFLPAAKELTLLLNGEHDGDVLDFNNIAADKRGVNKAVVNAALRKAGAELIGRTNWAYDIWASTDWDSQQTYQISSFDGSMMASPKDGANNQVVRCVLAF